MRIKKFTEMYWGTNEQPYWRPGANPTVDIIVIKDNNSVLLIQRSFKSEAEPGKWAIPGGFHDTTAKKGEFWESGKETAKEAAMRELEEETGLRAENYKNLIIEIGTYEHSGRDPRDNKEAWSKSTAFAIKLPKEANSEVEGRDDAMKAKWVPIEKAISMNLAFDHNKILNDALKKLKIL